LIFEKFLDFKTKQEYKGGGIIFFLFFSNVSIHQFSFSYRRRRLLIQVLLNTIVVVVVVSSGLPNLKLNELTSTQKQQLLI
jgi:hypothetical protein